VSLKWLQGKKTYIAAGALAVASTLFFFQGLLDAPSLTLMLSVAAGMAGLSAKLNRYLPDVATIAEDVKAKNYKAAESVVATDVAAAAAPGTVAPSGTGATSRLILLLILAAGLASLSPSAHAQCRFSCAPRAFARTARTMVTFHEDGHRAIGIALTEWAVLAATMADARETTAGLHAQPGANELSILLGPRPSTPRVYATEFGVSAFYNVFLQEAYEHNKKPWYLLPGAIPLAGETFAAWHDSNVKPLTAPAK
jgi:hypothetical protein